jgi:hypothetical protein
MHEFSASLWPSSAALSINCNNSSRVISFVGSLHFIVTGFFGWWEVLPAPTRKISNKKPQTVDFV